MSKSALVILAQGAEEMEITVEMLRRGGVAVTRAGLDGSDPVLCCSEVTVVPDKSLADAVAENPQYDAIIIPGGMEGSERLSKSPVVGALLTEQGKCGKIIAAMCAEHNTAFVAHGVGTNKRLTIYPSKDKIPKGCFPFGEGTGTVIVDDNVITSGDPGAAYWFGLTLIKMLTGKEKAAEVEKEMIICESSPAKKIKTLL